MEVCVEIKIIIINNAYRKQKTIKEQNRRPKYVAHDEIHTAEHLSYSRPLLANNGYLNKAKII